MNADDSSTYRSLSDIHIRKETLLEDIRKDDEQIRSMWEELFHRPEPATALTPSKRFNTLINTGAGILDAAILGWKLYHKFSGKTLFNTKKKKR